jgi:hypothetical protein
MAQPEINGTPAPPKPGTGASDATRRASQTPDSNTVAGSPDNPAHHASTESPPASFLTPPAYFGEALEDAERLLKYAAEIGIGIDDDTRAAILQARAAQSAGWTEEIGAQLLAALTKLAAQLRPVTAESLKAGLDDTGPTVSLYWRVALILAAVIVPFSVASFVTSAISNSIRADIATANELTVKIRVQLGAPSVQTQSDVLKAETTAEAAPGSETPTELGPPLPQGVNESDFVTELQQFASTIRAIDGRARQLNRFVLRIEQDPYAQVRNDHEKMHKTFELPVGLPNYPVAAYDRIQVYQNERSFAQGLLDDVSVFYGAIGTCLLPVLYALLGTCAYLLRTFEEQIKTRTFTPSVANSARFLIAGIGGAVVGLFNNFTITQGASIPPLAIAFLVGYAVDVFFSFLEGLLQTFTKTKSSTSSPAPTAS